MSNTAICSTADSRIKFWFLLLAFASIYLLFRLPWLSCDPGVPSLWEYGYNATDEGYYLSGGKEKFLWGYFVDLSRSEASTYGYSAGTHWLSYLAYLLFGLSTWAWRLPFFAICLCAWLTMFCHVARKAGAVASFVLCTSISIIPMLVAYERTASNDVLIGALVVMSYVCATGRSRFRIIAAGMLLGLVPPLRRHLPVKALWRSPSSPMPRVPVFPCGKSSRGQPPITRFRPCSTSSRTSRGFRRSRAIHLPSFSVPSPRSYAPFRLLWRQGTRCRGDGMDISCYFLLFPYTLQPYP